MATKKLACQHKLSSDDTIWVVLIDFDDLHSASESNTPHDMGKALLNTRFLTDLVFNTRQFPARHVPWGRGSAGGEVTDPVYQEIVNAVDQKTLENDILQAVFAGLKGTMTHGSMDYMEEQVMAVINRDVLEPLMNEFFEQDHVVVTFEYGGFTPGNHMFVYGINKTNVISVRLPPIQYPPQQNYEKVDVKIDISVLEAYRIAFGHFPLAFADLTNPEFDNTKNIALLLQTIWQPMRLAQWLNTQVPSPSTVVSTAPLPSDGDSPDDTPPIENWQGNIMFTLSQNFRFRLETRTRSHKDGTDDPEPTESQCIKFAGTYMQSSDGDSMTMQIDEVWYIIWQTLGPIN